MSLTQDAAVDAAIVDPRTYAQDEVYHALFTRLRREDPVHWTAPEGFRPFWTVSRHADIIEVERQNTLFLNDPRLVLMPVEAEERIKEFTGGGSHLLRSLVDMDDPDHRHYRAMTQSWFMPPNLQKLKERVAELARDYVARMETETGACDFVRDVAAWYPLRVIMMILGVPEKDEPLMLKLTQELFGAADADMNERAGEDDNFQTIRMFFDYFNALTEDRRKNPQDDVATIIANATLNNAPIGHLEAMSYYIIISTAGHDTTSSSLAGGLLALMQNPDQFKTLRADARLLPGAIDEMFRWATPVKHFFRTAAQDYTLRGRKMKAGDNLLMCYPSANRDEDVFDDPFSFNIARKPNRHLAFGHGAHLCLGQHLAKMEMRAFFEALFERLDTIEPAGAPAWTEASFVSGLKTLPVQCRFRQKKD